MDKHSRARQADFEESGCREPKSEGPRYSNSTPTQDRIAEHFDSGEEYAGCNTPVRGVPDYKNTPPAPDRKRGKTIGGDDEVRKHMEPDLSILGGISLDTWNTLERLDTALHGIANVANSLSSANFDADNEMPTPAPPVRLDFVQIYRNQQMALRRLVEMAENIRQHLESVV